MHHDLMQALTREGVLLNVSVSYWRACKKLHAEDLGLETKQVDERLFSLGRKRLLPKDALAQFALIESRAHALVERSTFPFLGGIARFLPNRKLAEVREALEGYRREFEHAKRTFMARYDDLRASAIDEWEDAARQLLTEPEALLAQLADAYPPIGALEKYFGFHIQVYQVTAPAALEAELVKFGAQAAIVEARRQAAAEAAAQLRQESSAFVADCVATLRQEAAHVCDEMLAAMREGKTDAVHQKTLNRLLKFIEDFKAMNFAGDREFERILEDARQTLLTKSAEDYRSNATALTRLQSGLSTLAQTARTLARQDAGEIVARFGKLGERKFTLAA